MEVPLRSSQKLQKMPADIPSFPGIIIKHAITSEYSNYDHKALLSEILAGKEGVYFR